MEITLLDAAEVGAVVRVTTTFGLLRGVWRGSTAAAAGEVHHVELDFPRPRSWSELRKDGASRSEAPATDNWLSARVAVVYEDGVIGLDFHGAAALMEMVDSAPSYMVGTAVCFCADDLEFYPTGI